MRNLSLTDWRAKLLLAKPYLYRLSWFSLLFALVKGNAFTATLFLSNFIGDIATYGLFEYALSFGIMIAIPLNFGLNGAYPYFNIRLKKEGFQSLFFLHAFGIGFLLLGLVILNIAIPNFIEIKYLLALLFGGVFALQIMHSVILKSHEVIQIAVLIDGGFFLILNAYNLFLFLGKTEFNLNVLIGIFGGYLSILTTWHFCNFYEKRNTFSFEKYFTALKFGKDLIVSAVLIIALTGSARIFIEFFLDLEAVGYYGFYFRLAAITVLLHQVVNIVFFKKMYQVEVVILDRYFSIFIQVIVVGALLFWLFVPMILGPHFKMLQNYENYSALYLILCFQMIFWITMALIENIIYREHLSKQMNKGFFALVFAMVLSFCLLYHWQILDIFSLSLVNMITIFLATEYQLFTLKNNNFSFKKLKLTQRSILAFFLIIYLAQ